MYNNALKSGYTQRLKYIPPKTKPKNRKINIIRFNPLYSKNVKTNISKDFIKLIEKHFPKLRTYAKIFNKNNLKISYSFTKNYPNYKNPHTHKKAENNNTTKTNN